MVSSTDPTYFDDPACPYSPAARDYLRKLTAVVEPTGRVTLFEEGQTNGQAVDTVIAEVEATIEEMKGLETQLAKAEPADRIAFYRAKTSMLERWTSLKEKLINMKMISEFQKVVIATMEEVLSKDEQQTFKNKLKGFGS